MKCGVPVVASNLTSIPEVGVKAIIYVDPFSVDSIKTGLIEALDESNFSIYRQKGLIQAENFNWDISANKIWKNLIFLSINSFFRSLL